MRRSWPRILTRTSDLEILFLDIYILRLSDISDVSNPGDLSNLLESTCMYLYVPGCKSVGCDLLGTF